MKRMDLNMKRKSAPVIFLIFIIIIFLCSCTNKNTDLQSPVATAGYKKITAEEAKDMMDGGTVIIVDVRTLEEYTESHIPGAVLIPNESISDTLPDQLLDTDAQILVYCRTGNRSAQASEKLIALGYTHVYDFGGIIDWPYDTVSGIN
jgi:rhodanese-related sulfurtransferase